MPTTDILDNKMLKTLPLNQERGQDPPPPPPHQPHFCSTPYDEEGLPEVTEFITINQVRRTHAFHLSIHRFTSFYVCTKSAPVSFRHESLNISSLEFMVAGRSTDILPWGYNKLSVSLESPGFTPFRR